MFAFVFFFKQKTAYEMRISDWSSDVCSSDLAYLEFFKGAWARWSEFNRDGDLLPYTWPARTLRTVIPTSLHGQLGYYSFDGGAPITAGTWQAAYSAAQVALTAQADIQHGARSAFALCRPPSSEARRVGKECGRTCRSRWAPYN